MFRDLEVVVAPDAVLASNTSSFSITSLAAGMKHTSRIVGMHFFNPAPILPLVEVVSGLATDRAVAELVYDTAKAWGKIPVHAKSTPGFIVNRCARPFYGEGLRILQENAADPATIDAVMREAGGVPHGSLRAHGPHRPRRELRGDEEHLGGVFPRSALRAFGDRRRSWSPAAASGANPDAASTTMPRMRASRCRPPSAHARGRRRCTAVGAGTARRRRCASASPPRESRVERKPRKRSCALRRRRRDPRAERRPAGVVRSAGDVVLYDLALRLSNLHAARRGAFGRLQRRGVRRGGRRAASARASPCRGSATSQGSSSCARSRCWPTKPPTP